VLVLLCPRVASKKRKDNFRHGPKILNPLKGGPRTNCKTRSKKVQKPTLRARVEGNEVRM